jgi:ankyrin repeat protein
MSTPYPKAGDLVAAASNGNLYLVGSLLDQGAPMEERDGSGDTPLNEAARKGHIEIVRLLIERGAKLSTPNNSGKTALAYAEERGYREIMQLLRDAAEAAKKPSKEWVLMAEDTLAYVRTYPKLLRKITEIFNFESRERLIISENMRTRAESVTPPTSFDELPQARVEQALEQFTHLGGVVTDKDFILRGATRLDKNKPGLGQSRPPT